MRKKFTKKKGGSGRGLSLTAKRIMSKSKASIRKRTIFERNIPMDIFIKEEDLAVEKNKFSDNVKEPFKNQYNLFFIYEPYDTKKILYFISPIQFVLNDLYFHFIPITKKCYKFKNIGIEISSKITSEGRRFSVKFKSRSSTFPGEHFLWYHNGKFPKRKNPANDFLFLEIASEKRSVFNTQSNEQRQSLTVQIRESNDEIETFNKIKDYCELKMDFYYDKYHLINKLIERIDYLIEIYKEDFRHVNSDPEITAGIKKYLNISSIPEKLLTEENFDDLKPFKTSVEIYKKKLIKIQSNINTAYQDTEKIKGELLKVLRLIIKKKEKYQKQSRSIGKHDIDKRESSFIWCNNPHHYIPENFEEYMDNFEETKDGCQANKFFKCSLPPVEELTSLPEATVIEPVSVSQKRKGKRFRESLRSFFGSKKKSLLNPAGEFSA